jgi:hypothetical protein
MVHGAHHIAIITVEFRLLFSVIVCLFDLIWLKVDSLLVLIKHTSVFPVPGGPCNSTPRAPLKPVASFKSWVINRGVCIYVEKHDIYYA